MDFLWTPTTKYHRKFVRKNLLAEVVHIVYRTIYNGKLECGKMKETRENNGTIYSRLISLYLAIRRHGA
jgi:hypothetical protein